jgi:hypothetical protein
MKDEIIVRLEGILFGLENVIKADDLHKNAKDLAILIKKDIKPIILRLKEAKNEE